MEQLPGEGAAAAADAGAGAAAWCCHDHAMQVDRVQHAAAHSAA